jgi:16S rRNA (guanine527-N7)-methyltransferase
MTEADREAALRLTPVSRETLARLDGFAALLMRWQKAVQLVAPSTLPQLWTRHIADSLQLIPHLGGAKRIADFGSGGGFPGLVLAIAMPDLEAMHLLESDTRKASFLREAARISEARVTVHAERIESAAKQLGGQVDTVIARALAPVAKLLSLGGPLFDSGAKAVFLKAQDIEAELTEASKSWKIRSEIRQSLTDPRGRILRIDSAERLPGPGTAP